MREAWRGSKVDFSVRWGVKIVKIDNVMVYLANLKCAHVVRRPESHHRYIYLIFTSNLKSSIFNIDRSTGWSNNRSSNKQVIVDVLRLLGECKRLNFLEIWIPEKKGLGKIGLKSCQSESACCFSKLRSIKGIK